MFILYLPYVFVTIIAIIVSTAKELDATRFKFVTRVHYWAADVGPQRLGGRKDPDLLEYVYTNYVYNS